MAYIQIYILRNGKKSRPKIAILSKQIEEAFVELYGDKSIFCLNPYLGVVCSSVRNKEIDVAETYSVKIIEIIEEYINSMENQYSLVANIHIAVKYFMLKQTERAESLFKEIFQQELEYVDDDKAHPYLEQIYLHLAIMHQSLKQSNSAMVMWKCLLKVHKHQFSFSLTGSQSQRSGKSSGRERSVDCFNSYISKDYYNIGKCYLQLEDRDKALYNFEMSQLASQGYLRCLGELEGQEAQYPHSYFEEEIQRHKRFEQNTLKQTLEAIEEIKYPYLKVSKLIKEQESLEEVKKQKPIKKLTEEEKFKKETGLSIITEESIQQSLFQTKFESIRKRAKNHVMQSQQEFNVQDSLKDPDSRLQLSEGAKNDLKKNYGFLMSVLSTGLGVWFLPTELRK